MPRGRRLSCPPPFNIDELSRPKTGYDKSCFSTETFHFSPFFPPQQERSLAITELFFVSKSKVFFVSLAFDKG
ncbi:hypothetical protein CaCOL14_005617 [Colletotrichum acutatum]